MSKTKCFLLVVVSCLLAVSTANAFVVGKLNADAITQHNVRRMFTQAAATDADFTFINAISPGPCKTDFEAIKTLMLNNTECRAYDGKFDNITALPKATLETLVNGYCTETTGCGPIYQAAFSKAMTTCKANFGEIPATIFATMRTIVNSVRLVCTRDTGKYCLPLYPAIDAQFKVWDVTPPADGAAVLAVLPGLCSPCIGKLLMAMRFANKDDKKFAAVTIHIMNMCSKIGADYCYPKFLDFSKAIEANTGLAVDKLPTGSLDKYCDACILPVMGRVAYAINLAGETGKAAELLVHITAFTLLRPTICASNDKGFCLPQVIANNATFTAVTTACADLGTAGAVCSTECSTAITAVNTAMGCCVGTLLNMGGPVKKVANLALRLVVNAKCNGLNLPLSCATQKALGALTVRNLAHAWCVANKEVCYAAIRADIAFKLGVAATLIKINLIKAAVAIAAPTVQMASIESRHMSTMAVEAVSEGVEVDFDVTVDANKEIADFTASASDPTSPLFMENVSALPNDAKIDPVAGSSMVPLVISSAPADPLPGDTPTPTPTPAPTPGGVGTSTASTLSASTSIVGMVVLVLAALLV